LRIELELLQIRLDERSASLEHFGESMFALDSTVDDLVHHLVGDGRGGVRRLGVGWSAGEEDADDC
jgi:hypothetical protein